MFTPISSLKNTIKKQHSTNNKNTLYKKLSDVDLHQKIKQLELLNFNNRMEKLRGDFKKDSLNFELLYTIIKLSNPVLRSNKNEKKNLINEILEIMKNRKLFFYFITFYSINDDILKKLIPSLKYDYCNKDHYIYKENDISEKFYFLIKGKISFRKKEIYNTNESSLITKEIEKFVLEENNYFGEMDLIYDRKKNYSAYCINDCHFLVIKKDIFKKLIEEKISKIETDKKLFLISLFNNYTKIPSIKLERFLSSNVQTLFFRRNEIIYKEGEDNINLYIIFIGEANLIKDINEEEFSYLIKYNESIKNLQRKASNINYSEIINLVKKKNKEEEKNDEMIKLDILLNKTKYNIVGNLVKGSIGGLEITTGIRKLKYSLISNSDFTCVLKVDLINIDDYLNMLMINLLPVFIKSEKNIHERIKNMKLIDENLLPYSCKKLKKNNEKIKIEKEEEENDKVYKRQIQKINDNFQLNRGGFIQMNDYNFNLHKQRNYFRQMLKKNKKNNNQINNILKNLTKEEKIHLKYTKFKMNNILSTPKKDINVNEFILSNKNKDYPRKP
jgi:CRP-like cAMP-binding protein